MAKPLVLCLVGTRPEAIKMAPLVHQLRTDSELETILLSTGQHREMLDQALGAFDLAPDIDLNLMQHGQTLAEVTARCLTGIATQIESLKPAIALGQGDTTTVLSASMAAFYTRTPFGHVEAGLRTPTIDNPFPEEFNRRVAGLVADLHFAPTQWSAENLRREGKAEESIFITGNTGVDAALSMANRGGEPWFPNHPGRIVLLTTHRRENWGEPMRRIALAALDLVKRFEDIRIVAPMHRNPVVRETLKEILGSHPRVSLIDPPDYPRFVLLMKRSTLILSDSGGVQEEAPAFGKPVLVLRDSTERPEGVEAGTARLVGTDRDVIVEVASGLLSDSERFRAMAQAISPYGDGKASERIHGILNRFLSGRPAP